jgi:hypothetical protein
MNAKNSQQQTQHHPAKDGDSSKELRTGAESAWTACPSKSGEWRRATAGCGASSFVVREINSFL